ncbi:MAG: tetratricopeptide repeat protein [Kiritimatiellae bacterium]|nr:tetratricopeptide repeat protein [Kiritimatiellia bacterium]HPB28250.1 CRISPR-associated primase-polymerase type A1 [Acidobacteriota bacterium]
MTTNPPVQPVALNHLRDLQAHGERDRLVEELERLRPESLTTTEEFDFIIEAALELGLPHVAEGFLAEKRNRRDATPADLLQAAALAASRGRPEEALEQVEQALVLDPRHLGAVRRKIHLLSRLGRPDEAEQFLSARAELFPAGMAQTLRETIRGSGEAVPAGDAPVAAAEPWTEAHIHRLLELFQGRGEVHARQWVSPGGGGGYNPVHQPLDPVLVEGHFAGRHTLGVYQLDEEARVRWIAFDVDIRKEVLPDALRRRSQWQTLMRQAFDTASALVDLCAVEGIPAAVEYSGFKGYHVWILLARPLAAEPARTFAEALRGRLDQVPPEISVEIFPKQVRLQGKQLGNLIKLPLGVHLRSGRRSEFVGPDGRAVPDSFEHLFALQTADPARILQRLSQQADAGWMESIAFPDGLPGPPSAMPRGGAELPWDPDSPPAYQPEADERLQFLLSRCAVLRTVVEKARDTGDLAYDEQLALVHTIGHLDNGVAAVNHLLGQLRQPAQELYLKNRLKGHPASCAKLRARAAASGSGAESACACAFGDNPGIYPNPLLHLNGFQPSGPAVDPTVRDQALRIQNLVRRYLDLREKLRRLDAEFGEVEKQVLELFRGEGVDSLPTPMGTLRLVHRDDGSPRMVLEL